MAGILVATLIGLGLELFFFAVLFGLAALERRLEAAHERRSEGRELRDVGVTIEISLPDPPALEDALRGTTSPEQPAAAA